MRSKGSWTARSVMLGVILTGAAGTVRAQTSTGRQGGTAPPAPHTGVTDPMSDANVPSTPAPILEKMAIARNDERQRKLQADTTQLLALATKLKEEVDKTDKYTLSLDVLKRTAEIEKLAKSIRERMKE